MLFNFTMANLAGEVNHTQFLCNLNNFYNNKNTLSDVYSGKNNNLSKTFKDLVYHKTLEKLKTDIESDHAIVQYLLPSPDKSCNGDHPYFGHQGMIDVRKEIISNRDKYPHIAKGVANVYSKYLTNYIKHCYNSGNHNNLRVTRTIYSLYTLGFTVDSIKAQIGFLQHKINKTNESVTDYKNVKIQNTFWKDALNKIEELDKNFNNQKQYTNSRG
jgi:hypothetical protein